MGFIVELDGNIDENQSNRLMDAIAILKGVRSVATSGAKEGPEFVAIHRPQLECPACDLPSGIIMNETVDGYWYEHCCRRFLAPAERIRIVERPYGPAKRRHRD